MANFLELANQQAPIKCNVLLKNYDHGYTKMEGTIEEIGREEIEQAAAAWMRDGWSGKVEIVPVEPKEFEPLTDSDLQVLVANGTQGVIFFAVQLGLTDYKTLVKFGYQLPKF